MSKFLVLLAAPRSGSAFFRVALTNYLAHLEGDLSRKDYDDLKLWFPNEPRDYVQGAVKPPRPSPMFDDFVFEQRASSYFESREQIPGPVICLVRNPLDYLVSCFHFFHKGRKSTAPQPRHPIEIQDRLSVLADTLKASRRVDAGLLLHYEDLFEYPADTFARAIRFYGLPEKPELIELALQHGSIDAARDYESAKGPINIAKDQLQDLEQGFRSVRSGAVGQWQDVFTPEQVELVRADLERVGVAWDNFIYQPRVQPLPPPPSPPPPPKPPAALNRTTYATSYRGDLGRWLDERKFEIAKYWANNTSWSEMTAGRDYDSAPEYVRLTRMVLDLVASGRFRRVVEIGCGDGKYLEHLKPKAPQIKEWIATDIQSPRLKHVKADIIECLKWNEAGTLFLSANVFDSIAPDHLCQFFSSLGVNDIGLAFFARGIGLQSRLAFAVRPDGLAFDHNFLQLIATSKLKIRAHEMSYDGNAGDTVGYWIAAAT